MTFASSLRRALLAVLLAVLAVPFAALTAHAEDGYRYWSYYQWTGGKWDYAQKGADGTNPADGSVEGWRFAVGGAGTPRTPRADGDFAKICAAAPAEEGKKRVAVVIDQGTVEDAPKPDRPNGEVRGTCVVTKTEATGAEVLGAVAEVRQEQGKTCGIGGYPTTACIDTVKVEGAPPVDQKLELTVQPPVGSAKAAAQPGAPQANKGPASQLTWAIIIALVAALAIGGWYMSHRRTKATNRAE